MNVSVGVIAIFAGFYAQATRTWTICRCTSEETHTRRGFFQGLPESPVELNYIMLLLLLARSDNIRTFADDLRLSAATQNALQELANLTESFLVKVGMHLAPSKCKWMVANLDATPTSGGIVLGGLELQKVALRAVKS